MLYKYMEIELNITLLWSDLQSSLSFASFNVYARGPKGDVVKVQSQATPRRVYPSRTR